MTAAARALSPAARALLDWLQERPAAGEGSLKAWGQTRRPQLTLTQVEVRAAELVEANLVTREIRPNGMAIYRARERAPEPPSVEVVTEVGWIPNTGAAGPFYGVDRSPEPAWHGGSGRRKKAAPVAPEAPAPCAECTRMAESRLEPLTDQDRHQIAAEILELRAERDRAIQDKARLADGLAHALGMDAGHPMPLSMLASLRIVIAAGEAAREERDRLAEALLSWERQWGRDGTDLAAMEERVRTAETRLAQVTAERDQLAAALAKTTPPEPPPTLSPNAQNVLAALSMNRGASPNELGRRARVLFRSVPAALEELRRHRLAHESTPGLWRRKLWATDPPDASTAPAPCPSTPRFASASAPAPGAPARPPWRASPRSPGAT